MTSETLCLDCVGGEELTINVICIAAVEAVTGGVLAEPSGIAVKANLYQMERAKF